jgi:hypothetical protein
MDNRPRALDDLQLDRLRALGRMVEAELESKPDEPQAK